MHTLGDVDLSSSLTMHTLGDGGLCDPLRMHTLGDGDCCEVPGQLPPVTISSVVDEPDLDILGARVRGRRRRFPIPRLCVNPLYREQRRQ